jgi:hypothetical protein
MSFAAPDLLDPDAWGTPWSATPVRPVGSVRCAAARAGGRCHREARPESLTCDAHRSSPLVSEARR